MNRLGTLIEVRFEKGLYVFNEDGIAHIGARIQLERSLGVTRGALLKQRAELNENGYKDRGWFMSCTLGRFPYGQWAIYENGERGRAALIAAQTNPALHSFMAAAEQILGGNTEKLQVLVACLEELGVTGETYNLPEVVQSAQKLLR